jgi:hypothetical protein
LFGVYSRFLHTTTAPAVMAIITRSRTISGQLMLITPGREESAAQLRVHLTPVSCFCLRQHQAAYSGSIPAAIYIVRQNAEGNSEFFAVLKMFGYCHFASDL